MPVGKTTKKKIQQNKSSTPAVETQSVHDVTVRDCLLWSDGQKKQSTVAGYDDVVYVSLRQQQQQQQSKSTTQVSQLRARVMPEDDGSVGDALRGWPRGTMQRDQVKYDADTDHCQCEAPTKTKTSQATNAVKSKSKSNVTKEKDEDVHVADLISQRFLHEYMDQREAEMERDRKKKEAREKAAREGRRAAKDRTDIKANKAAQLRAIALADRVEVSPFDLWKMDKFTRSARPHVSTFRNGEGPSGASASGARGAGDGRRRVQGGSRGGFSGRSAGGVSGRSSGTSEDYELVGACTCPERLPYYDGYDVYGSYDSCADDCQTEVVNCAADDGADCGYSYVETSYQSSSPMFTS